MAKYDLHFQPVSPDLVSGLKCIEFGYHNALKVTGFQYLVNRWLKTFLTPLGSDPLDREYGTAVGNLISANITQLTTEVQDVVALSVVRATEQVKGQDIEGLFPDAERLQNAYISRYVESGVGFDVWVVLESVAGDKLSIPAVTLGTART